MHVYAICDFERIRVNDKIDICKTMRHICCFLLYIYCDLRKPYVQAAVYFGAEMMDLLDIDTAVILVATAVIYHISDI